MSDTLTAAERAAIAAFPVEKIQRIPRGKSAFDYSVGPGNWKSQARFEFKSRNRRKELAAQELETMRERYRALCGQNKTIAEMAVELGVREDTVRGNLRRFSLTCAAEVSKAQARVVEKQRCLSELQRLHKLGGKLTEAARDIGMDYRLAKKYSAEIGLRWKLQPNGRA